MVLSRICAGIEPDHPVDDCQRLHSMGNHDHGNLRLQTYQTLQNAILGARIKRTGRFIEKEKGYLPV
jgi:hypothetical protein